MDFIKGRAVLSTAVFALFFAVLTTTASAAVSSGDHVRPTTRTTLADPQIIGWQ